MKLGWIAACAIVGLTAGCQSGSTGSKGSTAGASSGASTTGQSSSDSESPQVKTASGTQYSGFLSKETYAKLKPVEKQEGVMRFIDASADLRSYRKILFEPTEVYIVPNPDYKGIPRDELLRMTSDFQNSFKAALTPDYIIVTKPGRDVLRVRSAITGVQPAPPALGATDFIPIKALYNVARKAAGSAPKVAEMSAELEVLTPSGAVVGAATATRKGEKHLQQGEQVTWKDMQSISDYWAKGFRKNLDEMRGVSPAQ